jgi:hypothetical protein
MIEQHNHELQFISLIIILLTAWLKWTAWILMYFLVKQRRLKIVLGVGETFWSSLKSKVTVLKKGYEIHLFKGCSVRKVLNHATTTLHTGDCHHKYLACSAVNASMRSLLLLSISKCDAVHLGIEWRDSSKPQTPNAHRICIILSILVSIRWAIIIVGYASG